MKNYILIFLLMLMVTLCNAQCSVTIIPQGDTTFCNGDSVMLVAAATGGSSVIDQQDLVYNAGTSARNLPGYSIWQSFTAGISGTLNEVDLGFFNYINGIGTLSIYEGTGTAGLLLDAHQVNVYCSSGNCLVSFAENIPITSGNVYTIDFIPGTGIPDPYGVQNDIPGSYSGGTFAIVDPSGTYPEWDMVFQTHVGTSLYYLWSTGSTDTSIVAYNNGTYQITVTDSASCTVVDSIHVNVISVDTSVTVNGTTLHSNATSATYQWINCNTMNTISGATNQNYTALSNGSYAVIVTQNGCTDTSECYDIMSVGINEINNNHSISIYPNPNDGTFTISNLQLTNNDLRITDVLGNEVYHQLITLPTSSESKLITLSNLSKGVYFYQLINIKETIQGKFVKDK